MKCLQLNAGEVKDHIANMPDAIERQGEAPKPALKPPVVDTGQNK